MLMQGFGNKQSGGSSIDTQPTSLSNTPTTTYTPNTSFSSLTTNNSMFNPNNSNNFFNVKKPSTT